MDFVKINGFIKSTIKKIILTKKKTKTELMTRRKNHANLDQKSEMP